RLRQTNHCALPHENNYSQARYHDQSRPPPSTGSSRANVGLVKQAATDPTERKRNRFVWGEGLDLLGGSFRLWRCRLRLGAAPSIGGDLQPRMEGEFLQDVVNVSLYRIGGEVQAQGNLLVAQPVRDQVEDSPLSFRHADRLGHVCV